MWWSGEFTSPAPGHNPLEIMTEQDYALHGHDPYPSNSIVFNASPTKEIARFTEEGFYYKGEFIEDAGEVHRLLKAALGELLVVRNIPTDDELDERALFWWGPDVDERTVSEVIEGGSMSAFARYVLTHYAHKNQ